MPRTHRVADLLRNPRLLPVFLFSGLLATGWDMYTFVIPIYGTQHRPVGLDHRHRHEQLRAGDLRGAPGHAARWRAA